MSEKLKHTARPWTVKKNSDRNEWSHWIDANDENGVILVAGVINDADQDCDANARLIAAAPELLEALIEIIGMHDMIDEDSPYSDAFSKAESAIGKATQ